MWHLTQNFREITLCRSPPRAIFFQLYVFKGIHFLSSLHHASLLQADQDDRHLSVQQRWNAKRSKYRSWLQKVTLFLQSLFGFHVSNNNKTYICRDDLSYNGAWTVNWFLWKVRGHRMARPVATILFGHYCSCRQACPK